MLLSLRFPINICSFSTPVTSANGRVLDMQLAILTVIKKRRRENEEKA